LVVSGLDISDWHRACPPSQTTLEGTNYLRDYCGLQISARLAPSRPFRAELVRDSSVPIPVPDCTP